MPPKLPCPPPPYWRSFRSPGHGEDQAARLLVQQPPARRRLPVRKLLGRKPPLQAGEVFAGLLPLAKQLPGCRKVGDEGGSPFPPQGQRNARQGCVVRGQASPSHPPRAVAP